MNFKDCIDSYPFILMEGALGERLKREFDLDISGTVAMATMNPLLQIMWIFFVP